jgi:hypothetical protein
LKLNLDGTVWAIQRCPTAENDLDVFDERVAPLDVRGIKLVYPFYPTPRMSAQSGMFTLHGEPLADMVGCAGQPFAENELDVARLKRWTVGSGCKATIIFDLERMAVNSRTLFPDLEGLAKGLWQTEIIRAVKEER